MTLTHLVVAALLGAGVMMDVIIYRRQTRIEIKQNTIWGFIYSRAIIEALKQGFLVMNSPLTPRADLKEAYCSLAPQLADLYRQLSAQNLADPDIGLEFESRYREWIVEHICKPFNMDRGECLVIAVEIAKKHLEESESS